MRVAHDSRVFYFNTLHATPKPSRVGFNKHIVRTLWIRNRILESVASKVFQFPSLTDSQFPPNSQFGLVPSSLWFRTQFPSSKFYFQSSVFQVPRCWKSGLFCLVTPTKGSCLWRLLTIYHLLRRSTKASKRLWIGLFHADDNDARPLIHSF